MLLVSFLKPKLEKRRLILAPNPLCGPSPIDSPWQELCNDDCLGGGDGDVVRGRFGAGLDRHGGRPRRACLAARNDSGIETYLEVSCGIGQRHAR